MKVVAVALPFLLLLAPDTEPLTWKNYDKYHARIAADPSELRWQQVDWRNGFWSGLVEAQAKDKPIFYWIYEGDPRGGC